MKLWCKLFLISFSFLLMSFFSCSVNAQSFPSYSDKYVNDFAGILNSLEINQLRNMFAFVNQNSTAEVVFVSMDTIGDNDISQYASELGQSWGVGKKDKDNGAVILYVKDINKIWVATGYGLEGILPDSKIGRLLDEYYVPQRNSGNVALGIVSFSEQFSKVIIDNSAEVMSGHSGNSLSKIYIFIIIIVLIFIILRIIVSLNRNKLQNSRFWWIPIFLPVRSSSNGFGGGFGGGGFGGGGFGGGGAGR